MNEIELGVWVSLAFILLLMILNVALTEKGQMGTLVIVNVIMVVIPMVFLFFVIRELKPESTATTLYEFFENLGDGLLMLIFMLLIIGISLPIWLLFNLGWFIGVLIRRRQKKVSVMQLYSEVEETMLDRNERKIVT